MMEIWAKMGPQTIPTSLAGLLLLIISIEMLGLYDLDVQANALKKTSRQYNQQYGIMVTYL